MGLSGANDLDWAIGHSTLVPLIVDLTIDVDRGLTPFGERVDNRDTRRREASS